LLEKLNKRLGELQRQKQAAQAILDQALADVNAVNGAIQEVLYWIGKSKEAEKPETKSEGKSEGGK
jgi:hypothetical protein